MGKREEGEVAFVYLAGVTAPGAADEVVDWFATFEVWMLSAGWTVVAGAGTEDVTFRSLGEAGGLTMLYLRVWRDLGNVNRVYFRVQDDLAGTHVTTPVAGGYVDSGGVQFAFWMSGDMDAIIVCFKLGAGYRHVYAGMVIPFALTVPDETYRMILASDVVAATILRYHTGAWDQDQDLSVSPNMWNNRIDPFDGSFSLTGTYWGTRGNIAGQLKHISGRIQDPALNAEDTIATGRPGATSAWIVLEDLNGVHFAMRTGGVLPIGIPDGTFASVNGAAANGAAIYAALAGILVALGWTDLGDPGVEDTSRLFFSPGESGAENIYVLFASRAVGDQFYIYAQDDAIGTHRVEQWEHLRAASYPVNYWISADKDCVMLVVEQAGGYLLWWSGMTAPFAGGLVAPYPGPSLTEYSMIAAAQGNSSRFMPPRGLRAHTGVWGVSVECESDGDAIETDSNPNQFDGITYLVWPVTAIDETVGTVPMGQMKYLFHSHGGGIANLDTITVGAKVYTVFFDDQTPGQEFLIRTT